MGLFRELGLRLLLCVLLVAGALFIKTPEAGQKLKDVETPAQKGSSAGNLQWSMKDCAVRSDCVTLFLNSLLPERASEAKVVVMNDFYYIWYRK